MDIRNSHSCTDQIEYFHSLLIIVILVCSIFEMVLFLSVVLSNAAYIFACWHMSAKELDNNSVNTGNGGHWQFLTEMGL